jgi:hypothetical protein
VSTAGDALSKTLSSKPVPNVQNCRINPTLSHGYLQKEDLDESGMKVMDMMGPKKKKNDEREGERERERHLVLVVGFGILYNFGLTTSLSGGSRVATRDRRLPQRSWQNPRKEQ